MQMKKKKKWLRKEKRKKTSHMFDIEIEPYLFLSQEIKYNHIFTYYYVDGKWLYTLLWLILKEDSIDNY